MNALRLTSFRSIPRITATAARSMSSMVGREESAAVIKLRNAIEEYRQANYTQTIPSRFKKEIACAAANTTPAGLNSSSIAPDGLQRLLVNIGAEHRLANDDLQAIFIEVGDQYGNIPTNRFYQML